MTNYFLAPNARYQGRDQTGQPVPGGKLYTYITLTTTPKATYQDYQGLQPNTNPVILDGKGEANIYWADNSLYTIKLFTADDQEVETQDNYPVVGTNTTRIVSESESNVVRNNQFSYWNFGTDFNPVQSTGSTGNQDYFCDDWYYSRVDTSYTVRLRRQTFPADQDAVPGNPIYYCQYTAGLPATETGSRLLQSFDEVQTLANTSVTVAIYMMSPTASTVTVNLVQDFGGGGSASVSTLVGQFVLTPQWAQYKGSVTLPTMVGKTIGTDSRLYLEVRFPNDAAATVNLTNVQMQTGATLSNFPFQSQETQYQELVTRLQDALPSTGDVMPTFKTVAPSGWILCNDSTIGNVSSGSTVTGMSTKALFTLLWTNLSDTNSPMLTSAGAASSRGASAEIDWNALKRLTLAKTLGRALSSAGAGAGLTARTLGVINIGAETYTLVANDLPAHTHPGSFTYAAQTCGAGGTPVIGSDAGAATKTVTVAANSTTGQAVSLMQPATFMNFMIKL